MGIASLRTSLKENLPPAKRFSRSDRTALVCAAQAGAWAQAYLSLRIGPPNRALTGASPRFYKPDVAFVKANEG
jgi:hypothetical protein